MSTPDRAGVHRQDPNGSAPLPHARHGVLASLHGMSPQQAQWVLAVALLAVMSYFPALQGGFVWDDVIFSEEPVIHAADGLRSIWFAPADIRNEGHYWPLVYTSFWLEHRVWGLEPLGYHAVNIVLHLLNCLLLWRLLLRLRVPGAAVIAAVFAVHPVHVESVAWIIERKDVLSGLFYLSAVLVWTRFVAEPRPARYALALGLFTAGLLSKSVVVTLPVALLIWHWWRQGRVRRIDLLRLAPFAAVAAAITAGDLSFYTSREPLELGYYAGGAGADRGPRPVVLCRQAGVAGESGGDLSAVGDRRRRPAGDGCISSRRRRWRRGCGWHGAGSGRGPLAGVLFFAVTLGPVLGFVDYGYMQFSLVADRFQYLAGIGVLAVLIGAAAHGVAKLPDGYRRGALGLAVAVVVALGTLTWRQAGIYRDEVALFSHVVALNPEARDAHLNLGSALFEEGSYEEGLAASRIAAAQRPDSSGALANVGRALVGLQRFEEAEDHLRRAVQIDPRSTTAHQNLAEALRKQERYAEAVAAYRAVLAIDDGFALAYAGLGMALFEDHRYAEALQAVQQALSLKPDLSTAGALHLHMGRAARELGRPQEAAQHFERALEIEPGTVQPLFDLAKLRFSQGRSGDADRILRRARELRPADPATLHNVAEALRLQERYEDAIAHYRSALGIDPEFAPAHAGLGIALFQWERYAEAIEALERALALLPDVPVTGSSLHVFLGRAAQKLGRPEAAEHFARAVLDDPRDREALDHLAMARFAQQRYEEALALYRTLIEIDPDNAVTHSNLGAALYHLGRLEAAQASIERALSLDPDLEIARIGRRAVRDALAQRER